MKKASVNFWLILVTIVWGTTFFIVKDAVVNLNEYFIVFVRNGIAALPMFIIVLIRNPKILFRKKNILFGAVLGFFLAMTYASQTIGLIFTSSGHSAFITGSAVIFVPLIMWVYYKNKIASHILIAGLICLVGLFFLCFDFETSMNVGDLITFITVAAYANNVILAGRFIKKGDVPSIITYQFVFAAVFSLIAFLISPREIGIVDTKAIWSLVYLGLAGTLFCYFITVWIQKYTSTVHVSMVFSLEPVFAAIFAYYFANETMSLREILGMLLILLGISIYNYFDYRTFSYKKPV